jgi:hypothetical protein
MGLSKDLVDTLAYREAILTTDPNRLSRLAEHDEHWVRVRVAGNRHTALADLLKLAEDPDRAVRANVACNNNLPLESVLKIEALAQLDRNETIFIMLVQASLASRHEGCSTELYWRLFETKCFGVLVSLANNPAIPQNLGVALAELVKHDNGKRWKEVSQIASRKWHLQEPPEE